MRRRAKLGGKVAAGDREAMRKHPRGLCGSISRRDAPRSSTTRRISRRLMEARLGCSSDFVTLDCAENVVLEDSRAASMRERLHYSPQVQLDLDEIFDCFSLELGNPEKDEEVVNGILAAAKQIPGHVTRFPRVGPLPLTNDDYRFVAAGSYLMFFHVIDADVYVDRVLCKRRDFASLLGMGASHDFPVEV